jgi:hypothetical protein
VSNISNIPDPDQEENTQTDESNTDWKEEVIKLNNKNTDRKKVKTDNILNNALCSPFQIYLNDKGEEREEYGKKTPLHELLKLGEKCKKEIDFCRTISNEKEYKEYRKLNIPMFTPSASFTLKHTHKLEYLEDFNNLICVDIDFKDNPTLSLSEMKERTNSLDFVCYSNVSVGGKGIFALICLDCEHDTKSPDKLKEEFLQYFNALQADFRKIGIVIDNTCKDITRTRFASYSNNEEHIKEYAFVYDTKYKVPPIPEISNVPKALPTPETKEVFTDEQINVLKKSIKIVGRTDTEKFKNVMKDIEENNINIIRNNTDRLHVLSAILKLYGEHGLEFWLQIRKAKKDFDPEKESKKYKEEYKSEKYKKYNFNFGTIFDLYQIAKAKSIQSS